ncbi:MAG: hypothetical protein KAI73_05245 [Rhodospirillaceae bacterium]|nr:hypothetical protein [Rhodospirillaceae bacterium]
MSEGNTQAPGLVAGQANRINAQRESISKRIVDQLRTVNSRLAQLSNGYDDANSNLTGSLPTACSEGATPEAPNNFQTAVERELMEINQQIDNLQHQLERLNEFA